MHWLLSRELIVASALLSAAAALLAVVLKMRAGTQASTLARINRFAYCLMAISMLLFIIKGLQGSGT